MREIVYEGDEERQRDRIEGGHLHVVRRHGPFTDTGVAVLGAVNGVPLRIGRFGTVRIVTGFPRPADRGAGDDEPGQDEVQKYAHRKFRPIKGLSTIINDRDDTAQVKRVSLAIPEAHPGPARRSYYSQSIGRGDRDRHAISARPTYQPRDLDSR